MRKISSDIFSLRKTSYLSENCFMEMPTGRKNRNYTFVTAPEHICNELNKLNNVNKNMKSAVDSIYCRNRFELLNFKTTENDENDHPYHSIVGSDSKNYHSSESNRNHQK